ncbi:hypothetical protein ACGFMM_01325 [Streptomyces sp. NPDC048604]|uniref:hypothetical protein n=1 Tax=Streptomyces sp. NPDC048604 TaxID=3365578 RepID=UPI00370F893B
MAERLTFVLDGRDDLSRVLGHAGDSATRLRSTMQDATDGSNRAILTLTRDADGRLRDLEGRFVNAADAARLMATRTGDAARPMADWANVADRSRKVGEQLRAMLISLAPAAIPAAAAMAPLVAATAAAGVAVGVYAAALGPQIAALSEAAQAEKKYTDAVAENGKQSEEAVQAQVAYAKAVAKLPPATREAAAALSVFKDEYKDWSDSLAEDTTGPVIKGLGAVGGLLPKLSPLVRGTSTELERMMTLLAGGIQSPGLDRVIKQFTAFSTGVLREVNNDIVRLARTLDTGEIGAGFADFMNYARANGPVVGETLRNIGEALANVLRAGSDVGVGMLQVVNVLSELVAAVPAGALTTLFQLAIALKLAKLAAVGLGAGRAAVAAFGAQILTMRAAAAGASGGLAGLGAAFTSLSRTARVALIGSGIGLLVIALSELMSIGQAAPADMDKMSSSLAQFGRTGQLSGEAARILSSDFKEFDEALRGMARPDSLNQIQQSITQFVGQDSTPVKRWKGVLEGVDEALASMVKSGNAQLAAAAFDQLAKRAESQGLTTEELRTQLDGYKQSLADVAFEQQLVAESQGLFGQQALATSQKLNAQKASADGLRQSLQALNDVQRQGIGGMIGFEAAIDATAKAARENAGALTMSGGQLNLNSEKARNAATALNDLAAKTDEATASARESGASWSTVNGIYARGREQLLASAQAMGLTKEQARQLADQILQTPDKTARLKGNMDDLEAKLAAAKRKLAAVPDARKAQVRAEIYQLEQALAKARSQLDAIDGKKAHTYVITHLQARKEGVHGTQLGGAARGGLVPGYAGGGPLQAFPQGGFITGPGSTMSDSIVALMGSGARARVSNREYVVRAAAVQRYGVAMFDALNAMRLPVPLPSRTQAMAAPTAGRMVPVAGQPGVEAGGGRFEGDLYLDSGEFLGAVRGVVRPMLRDSEQRQARRAKTGRAL